MRRLSARGRRPLLGDQPVHREVKRTRAERLPSRQGSAQVQRGGAHAGAKRADLRRYVVPRDVELESADRVREPLQGAVDSRPSQRPSDDGLGGRPELEGGAGLEISRSPFRRVGDQAVQAHRRCAKQNRPCGCPTGRQEPLGFEIEPDARASAATVRDEGPISESVPVDPNLIDEKGVVLRVHREARQEEHTAGHDLGRATAYVDIPRSGARPLRRRRRLKPAKGLVSRVHFLRLAGELQIQGDRRVLARRAGPRERYRSLDRALERTDCRDAMADLQDTGASLRLQRGVEREGRRKGRVRRGGRRLPEEAVRLRGDPDRSGSLESSLERHAPAQPLELRAASERVARPNVQVVKIDPRNLDLELRLPGRPGRLLRLGRLLGERDPRAVQLRGGNLHAAGEKREELHAHEDLVRPEVRLGRADVRNACGEPLDPHADREPLDRRRQSGPPHGRALHLGGLAPRLAVDPIARHQEPRGGEDQSRGRRRAQRRQESNAERTAHAASPSVPEPARAAVCACS